MGSKNFRLGIRLLIKLVIETTLVNADHQFWPVGESCTPTGKIVCFAGRFQQCASGAWSAQTSLAAGDDCSIFSASLMAAPITTSSTTPLVDERCVSQVYSSDTVLQPTMIEPASASESGGPQPVVQKQYSGPASNFPPESSWLTFDRLWDHNKAVCEKNPDGKAGVIHDDILKVAKETGVDARIIFAVILQESTCLLALATTQGPIANAGLMQSHDGVGYTDDASILQMIRDGTDGTYYRPDGGDGLKQVIHKYKVYGGLRAYNSGDFGLDENDLSSANTGSPSYVSDIANRLTGAKIAS
jgi:hypothetical protein